MDKKRFLYLSAVLLIIIIILGVFGYFYWQKKKEAELESLLKQEKKEPIKILTREEILESLTAPKATTSPVKFLESDASKNIPQSWIQSATEKKVLRTLTAPKQNGATTIKPKEREKILESLSAP
ncbi:MAG: hypothetical protein A3H02_01840 [Candidatus Niyogibacteria bacterium RIFCSPLOWO2_12_FULL_41_13]|uniref:Uncharacterized protein n=1 Tax=Candidatus Niyogibacteria bacterium RIFCSPLOWO2_12_FULL_41_13 TaxID=1801726 RepID=A0A1G2F3V8_9BACT|nr:MAG: hypothetical protein A3H02_01840 [Candidatus Niyogibacteria bacterium RIFCSPLOWO2_12_FULL_41_13]